MSLKSFSSDPSLSKGRLHQEINLDFRNNFQHDRDRLIHTTAFRRLEYKTQVFVNLEGDHYRTRLTHTLEVSQIARIISRALGLCEDLTEVIALAHDLGHPPFGHAGEEALNNAMAEFRGFDHNIHTLKILTALERCYTDFDGLNLSWEVLEGIAKHNGPLKDITKKNVLTVYSTIHNLELLKFPSLEAQIASLADDIAYSSHDIEDGIRAGFCSIEDFYHLPMVGGIFRSVAEIFATKEDKRLIQEAIRRLTDAMIMDLIKQTQTNIEMLNITTIEDIYNAKQFIAEFSPEMQLASQALKQFLFENVYRHPQVNIMAYKARKIVTGLFQIFFNNPDCLPQEWQKTFDVNNKQQLAITTADFIAGMTDRFAIKEYKLFSNM